MSEVQEQCDLPAFRNFLSKELCQYLLAEARDVAGVPGLQEIGPSGGLETTESFQFLCELYHALKEPLNQVLEQRNKDRRFIDERTDACFKVNMKLGLNYSDTKYQTVLGLEDTEGRVVFGPKNPNFYKAKSGQAVAALPTYLQGPHVTLFGPPENVKLSINAMNSFHRQIPGEPAIVSELLALKQTSPMWGADDEDSKTPLRRDLISAEQNLSACFNRTIRFEDPDTKINYQLESNRLALPIKRFPGLAMPCSFLFYQKNPIPLHLYDFAIHLFHHWQNPQALSFYVPKLETEEEAAYIAQMVRTAEALLQKAHPSYVLGTIRLFIVLENPRAIFRVHEIMDALHPYFAGASLGWHDYLASTARLFKNEPNYRIPVKADPNIVIKYIKASHDLLAHVVGSRGGIKIGGMYGILPMDRNLKSLSFQRTLIGYFKDVITQLKRGLSGFWVAHPDFVRIGLAIVNAWELDQAGHSDKLQSLVKGLFQEPHATEILEFIEASDIEGFDVDHVLYSRSLILADLVENSEIKNNDPEEIRYNVFQSLQYLTDWLCGNGCVALPAIIDGIAVRVMDDLATLERSRWEIWHEVHHGRFQVESLVQIIHEEMQFIRKDLSNQQKIVQVKWTKDSALWYPVAEFLLLQLTTNPQPVEFASELLLPFTVESLRDQENPLDNLQKMEPGKYELPPYVERLHRYFGICGSLDFAKPMAECLYTDFELGKKLILGFEEKQISEAAFFHGDIGQQKQSLDQVASKEQALVSQESAEIRRELLQIGEKYHKKFGLKFLVSAKGKKANEILSLISQRLTHSKEQELNLSCEALWQISESRMRSQSLQTSFEKIDLIFKTHLVRGASIAISNAQNGLQSYCYGYADEKKVTSQTWFELASLSKTLASCFAQEFFKQKEISLTTSVNALFEKYTSKFRLKSKLGLPAEWANEVNITHLLNHTALNMHYVNGFPASQEMPKTEDLLFNFEKFGYEPVEVVTKPGTFFRYSGAGYLVLEYLIETITKQPIQILTDLFFKKLGLSQLSFKQQTISGRHYAHGYQGDKRIEGTRKMFPSFAAGAMGNALGMAQFLSQLTHSKQSLDPTQVISHDTAVRMSFGQDFGSGSFMGAKMGLGVFVGEAGPNKILIHQGANDGFRSLFMYCCSGPDRHKGVVILCNADENGVAAVAEAAQNILRDLKIQGIDSNKFQKQISLEQIKPEDRVNIGYRDLIFNSFEPDLPEKIFNRGPNDPLSPYNLVTGAKILFVSNQKFALAENLLSQNLPTFDPKLFGRQGKVMDSWETVRHNDRQSDQLVFQLKQASCISFVKLSTQFHLGNQAQFVLIEGSEASHFSDTSGWMTITPKTGLQGHAECLIRSQEKTKKFNLIRVSIFPDGGLTRLGLFGENLPEFYKAQFQNSAEPKFIIFPDPIPQVKKPLSLKLNLNSKEQTQTYPNAMKKNNQGQLDLACSAFGAKIISASNEHYGPAEQVISPFPALHMFDGFESARSRLLDHSENFVIALARPGRLNRIEVDFEFFRNNNPRFIQILGLQDKNWLELVKKTDVKQYAGSVISFELYGDFIVSQLKIIVFPDGGLNRLCAFGTPV